MAAIQTHKPADQETTAIYRKTTIETGYNKANNEHSFGNKIKEMANSATKLFHHGQNEHHQPNNSLNKQHDSGYKAQLTGTGNSSNTTHATQNMLMQTKKKKDNVMTCAGKKKKKPEKVTFTAGKKDEKLGGSFLANMEEHVKNFAHKVEGKKKSKGHSSSSDDSSSDESDKHSNTKKK